MRLLILLSYFSVLCLFNYSLPGVESRAISSITKQSTRFSSIFAFGDSYTDNGSLTTFYKQKLTRIDKSSLHPSTAGPLKRSADGPLWVEYLADYFNDANLYDFARSGSTANNKLIFRSTEDMYSQIDAYLASDASTKPKDNSIFFLWTGVNDMNDLFSVYETDTPERRDILDGVFQTIEINLNKLYDSGARTIMLMGLIPLETLPMYHNVSSETRENLHQLVSEYNAGLRGVMDAFNAQKTDAHAIFFDTNALFRHMYSSKEIEENAISDCNKRTDCQDYIWWDYLHPSTKTHERIAKAIYQTIEKLGW